MKNITIILSVFALVAGSGFVITFTSCNTDNMKPELPEYALFVLRDEKNALVYLTSVGLLSDYGQQYVTFIGNGDYFLSYEIEDKEILKAERPSKRINRILKTLRNLRNNSKDEKYFVSTIVSRYILHIIPEGDRFRLEARLESSTFYRNGKNVGHVEPNGEWVFEGYSDNKYIEAAKILNYFNERHAGHGK